MSVGEHKSVTVDPWCSPGGCLEEAGEEDLGNWCHSHGHTRVTRVGLVQQKKASSRQHTCSGESRWRPGFVLTLATTSGAAKQRRNKSDRGCQLESYRRLFFRCTLLTCGQGSDGGNGELVCLLVRHLCRGKPFRKGTMLAGSETRRWAYYITGRKETQHFSAPHISFRTTMLHPLILLTLTGEDGCELEGCKGRKGGRKKTTMAVVVVVTSLLKKRRCGPRGCQLSRTSLGGFVAFRSFVRRRPFGGGVARWRWRCGRIARPRMQRQWTSVASPARPSEIHWRAKGAEETRAKCRGVIPELSSWPSTALTTHAFCSL